jgi:uncharacterized protein RhaS with RHS repeats
MAAVDIKEVDGNYWRGWHVIDGVTAHSSSNDNTITGEYRSGSNSYFVFDLSAFTATAILSVDLELELENYNSVDATETLSVWDVSTDSATVEADGYDENIYNDLMTGNLYGRLTVNSGLVGSVLSIPLDAQAAIDVENALGGDFSVGVHLDTEPPGFIRFSNGSEVRTHRLLITYVP